MFTLPKRFEVILVFPIADTVHAYQKPEVLAVLEALGEVTDGASTSEGLGYWKPTEEFERAIHVYTFYDGSQGTLEAIWSSVLPVVTTWACVTDQEAVAFEVNGELQIWDTADLLVENYKWEEKYEAGS